MSRLRPDCRRYSRRSMGGWVIDILVGWLLGSVVGGLAGDLVTAGDPVATQAGVLIGTVVGIWTMRRRRAASEPADEVSPALAARGICARCGHDVKVDAPKCWCACHRTGTPWATRK